MKNPNVTSVDKLNEQIPSGYKTNNILDWKQYKLHRINTLFTFSEKISSQHT